MRRISLKELHENFAHGEFEFAFSLEDQSDRFATYITVLDSVYDTMLVAPALHTICFKSNNQTMRIDCVKCVEESSVSEIGTVFDVVSKSKFDEERRYRFWARNKIQRE